MSGGGHIADMLARMRVNKSFSVKQNRYFVNARAYKRALNARKLEFRHSTQSDLIAIRKEIQRSNYRRSIRDVFSVVAAVVILTLLVLAYQYWYNSI